MVKYIKHYDIYSYSDYTEANLWYTAVSMQANHECKHSYAKVNQDNWSVSSNVKKSSNVIYCVPRQIHHWRSRFSINIYSLSRWHILRSSEN